MRRWVEGTFMMAALPWLQSNSFLDRELGINLTPFNSDMLDWRNNLWNANPNRPAIGLAAIPANIPLLSDRGFRPRHRMAYSPYNSHA